MNGRQLRQYRADFIVLLDDNHLPRHGCTHDRFHRVDKIKGCRGEDAKQKKSTKETFWVADPNHLGDDFRAFAIFMEGKNESAPKSRSETDHHPMIEEIPNR